EIDLRRLLSLNDINPMILAEGGTPGYASIPQPTGPGVANDPANYFLYTGTGANPMSRQTGHTAYFALYDTRWRGATLPTSPSSLVSAIAPAFQNWTSDAVQRYRDYEVFGVEPRSGRFAPVFNTSAKQQAVLSGFDLSDELELRAFAGIND